ncbi:hypothetical protein [Mangrovimonas yunxiaonensis]|nr:hypothetical protein [Mangrovimonas yunxiaonensis]
MKNLKRLFLLAALAFLAGKVLSSDFDFDFDKSDNKTAAISAEK